MKQGPAGESGAAVTAALFHGHDGVSREAKQIGAGFVGTGEAR